MYPAIQQIYYPELSVSSYPANFTIWNHLYPAIGKFHYPELSVSGYPANFTIRASLIWEFGERQ